MFAEKMVREAKEHAAALKEKLVQLYTQLQHGDVPDDKRKEVAEAIEKIKAHLDAHTKRLCGEAHPGTPNNNK